MPLYCQIPLFSLQFNVWSGLKLSSLNQTGIRTSITTGFLRRRSYFGNRMCKKSSSEPDKKCPVGFSLNLWFFCSSRPKNKVKTPQNRTFFVRVKRIKTVYAFAVKNAREGDILRQGVFWLNIWVFWSSKPKNKAKALKNRPFHVRVKRRKMLYTVPVKSWNDTAKIWQVGFWLNIWLFSFFVNDNR